MNASPGRRFADAVARKDRTTLVELLAPDLDFKGLTPRKFWEGRTPDELLEVMFGTWFDDDDHIDRLVEVTEGADVGDTQHVGYRLEITNADGPHVLEQQAYYRSADGRIDYLRVLCSGFRPLGSSAR